MKYRFTATRTFWRSFGKLSARNRSTREKPSRFSKKIHSMEWLRSHKIHKLSARYARSIYAAEIEANLRVIFYIDGNLVVTVDIGSHDIYRA